MPRFVILRHDTSAGTRWPLHWDFMLETRDVLRTWALSREPVTGVAIQADALADHRIAYLDYEGPISGDRGSVTREDFGTYEIESERSGELTVLLTGQRRCGRVILRQNEPPDQRWRITFFDD